MLHPSFLPFIAEDRSNIRGTDAQVAGASNRDYLNGLVEASVAKTANQTANVAYVKTHKTGSSTMASIMYRYAKRHDLERNSNHTSAREAYLVSAVEHGEAGRVDIMHYHITPKGQYLYPWSEARKNYRGIMRDPDHINFITIMREPRSHFLRSYYYYFIQPENQLSIEEYFLKGPRKTRHVKLLGNPLSAEFGVSTPTELEHLIAQELSSFKLIVLTEQFDEGLLVLRRLLGWDMIDMTYAKMKVSTAGYTRWDGKQLVQDEIDASTKLDHILYTAAQEHFAKRMQVVSNVIEADLEGFTELQHAISDYLDANDSSKAVDLRTLERLADSSNDTTRPTGLLCSRQRTVDPTV
eukprot:jgi/Undpi1/8345/HiC_scaffold_25.g10813.m1